MLTSVINKLYNYIQRKLLICFFVFQRSKKRKIPTICRAKYGILPYSSSFFIQTILSVLEFHQINDLSSLSDYTAGGDILPALKVVILFVKRHLRLAYCQDVPWGCNGASPPRPKSLTFSLLKRKSKQKEKISSLFNSIQPNAVARILFSFRVIFNYSIVGSRKASH